MGEQGAIRPSPTTERKGESSDDGDGGGGGGGRVHRPVGEFAGGTTAECAMVCCCCPCAVLDFLVLTLYRVPVGLCRKAWRRRKQKRLLMKKRKMEASGGSTTTAPARTGSPAAAANAEIEGSSRRPKTNSVDFEREMWGRFYGGGFWRSASEMEDTISSPRAFSKKI